MMYVASDRLLQRLGRASYVKAKQNSIKHKNKIRKPVPTAPPRLVYSEKCPVGPPGPRGERGRDGSEF